jgi:hypothetical protein
MSRILTYREALREGLDEELARDPNVVLMGEEVAQYNGAYKVTEGLWKKWGNKRVVDTPISEAGFIGMGIGASMLGVRPVMELMFWSFHSVAFDQLVSNAACIRYMSGGLCNCPIVVRGRPMVAPVSEPPTPTFLKLCSPRFQVSRFALPQLLPMPRASSKPPSVTTTRFTSWKTPCFMAPPVKCQILPLEISWSRSAWPTSNVKARTSP